jgi:hypothetical protein
MEASFSSERLIPTYQITRYHTPEDYNMNLDPCANLKLYNYIFMLCAMYASTVVEVGISELKISLRYSLTYTFQRGARVDKLKCGTVQNVYQKVCLNIGICQWSWINTDTNWRLQISSCRSLRTGIHLVPFYFIKYSPCRKMFKKKMTGLTRHSF